MNSSKDHSSIISAGNNSMNTSHFNITTDHSSFEFGGLSSTPNSKFLLDKIFEKPSPQTTNYFLQQQQQQQQPTNPTTTTTTTTITTIATTTTTNYTDDTFTRWIK